MQKNFKHLILICTSVIFLLGCQHDQVDNLGGTTPKSCKIDKIQSYGIISATIPEDFYFIYNGDHLTQINGVVTSNSDIFRATATYANGNVSKIETYGLDGTSTLQLTGYIEFTYAGNNISQLKLYEKLSGVFVLRYVHELFYDGNGKRNKKIIKVYSGNSIQLQYITNYTYDGLGNILKMDETDGANQLIATFNFEYNNKENPLLSYHKQMDVFGWIFFDGPYFYSNAWTDARILSKYQIVKQIQNFVGSTPKIYNYSYTYDTDNKIIQVTSSGDINKALITYKCN